MTQKIWNQDKKDIEKSYQDLRIVILNKSKSKYKITKIDKYDYGLGTSSIENIHFGQPIFSESLDFKDWCTVDTSGRFTVVYDSLHTVCMNLTVILPLVNSKLNEIFRYQHIVNQFIQSKTALWVKPWLSRSKLILNICISNFRCRLMFFKSPTFQGYITESGAWEINWKSLTESIFFVEYPGFQIS